MAVLAVLAECLTVLYLYEVLQDIFNNYITVSCMQAYIYIIYSIYIYIYIYYMR